MQTIFNPLPKKWPSLTKRPSQDTKTLNSIVNDVFRNVKERGDRALKKYTKEFDGVSIDNLKVSQAEIDLAFQKIPQNLKDAIALAKENIYKFHSAQQRPKIEVETTEGVFCWQEKRPIAKVGLYIPGGTAPLFSTVLMLAIPAKIAGCAEIILCTPPNAKGEIAPEILYTAMLCGVTKLYKVGGIQAIAAMTFGTETIPSVYKLFGPGNQFVTAAKQKALDYGLAIDMPAGPSELLVFADETAVPQFVAADLLSQAEHGADSQVVLLSTSEEIIKQVQGEITAQVRGLSRRNIAEKALENAQFIKFSDKETSLHFINEYAPEHFIVVSKNTTYFIDNIQNAGSVFIGNFTPESAGDYASGTNHTLPTNGFAKQYSGVNLDSFLKAITFQKVTPPGLEKIGNAIELMAAAEGLDAHKNAVTLRLKAIRDGKTQL